MNELQYWSKSHKKVLRVQQSMHGPYRVVSILPESAGNWFVSNYTVPSWARRYPDRAGATAELKNLAAVHDLEKWGQKS